jgi:hypothetical protein
MSVGSRVVEHKTDGDLGRVMETMSPTNKIWSREAGAAPIRTHHFWNQAREGRLRAFSHRHHVSIPPRHQGHNCRPCEIFQGGRNVFRVVPLDHLD